MFNFGLNFNALLPLLLVGIRLFLFEVDLHRKQLAGWRINFVFKRNFLDGSFWQGVKFTLDYLRDGGDYRLHLWLVRDLTVFLDKQLLRVFFSVGVLRFDNAVVVLNLRLH